MSTPAGFEPGAALPKELAAASLCLINIFFAWKFLRESRDMTEAHEKKPRASRTVIAHVVAHPGEDLGEGQRLRDRPRDGAEDRRRLRERGTAQARTSFCRSKFLTVCAIEPPKMLSASMTTARSPSRNSRARPSASAMPPGRSCLP